MKQVVRGFVYDSETKKYLLVKHKNNEIWTLPGGHIDDDETPYQAFKREILEEFNLKIKIKGKKTKLEFENIEPLPSPIAIYEIEFISKKYGLTQKTEYIFKSKVKQDSLADFRVDANEISEYAWMSAKEIFSLKKNEIYGQFLALLKKVEK